MKETNKQKIQCFMKILGKMSNFLTRALAKMSQNIFAYFSVLEHCTSFLLFHKKKHLFWLRPWGLLPLPPFTDWSITYSFLFFIFIPLFEFQ